MRYLPRKFRFPPGDGRSRRSGSRIPDPVLRLGIVAALLVGGTALVFRAIPPAFKDTDYQIAAATERERSRPLAYAGATACTPCHEAEHDVKRLGYHHDVSCETCHGPSQAHAENPVDVKLPAPRDRKFCPTCHAHDPSRPMGFPQINPITHNPLEACISCHNPHDPKPPTAPGACAACHAEIERTKTVSPHVLLECTTCHETPEEHKITPAAARPSKPMDRAFCGACHGADSAVAGAPKVDLETHEVKYLCWQCHYPHMPEVE